MRIQDINPYIRIATRSVMPSHYELRRRIIFDYELIYVESGSVTLGYLNDSYDCVGGDVIFIRPGAPHSLTVGDAPLSQPHIHFDISHSPDSHEVRICFKDVPELTSLELEHLREDVFSRYEHSPILKIKNRESFVGLFYSVITSGDSLAKKGLMTQLISQLVKDNFPDALSEHEDYPVERQIKDWIDAGQCLDMSLDAIAARFSYNKFYLEKRFKESYNIGIMAYRNKRRLEMARELIRTESVMGTAMALGYGSIYSFSRAFKAEYGVSPSKLKNRRELLI